MGASLLAFAQDSSSGDITDSTQGFALFESVETAASQNRAAVRVEREVRATTTEPEFTLLGVSRIAGNYSAMLQHKNGESILVKADPSASTFIPDYSDYSIVGLSATTVSVRYPGNNPCVEFVDQGVSCNSAANIAELSLSTGEPIPPKDPTNTELASTDSQNESDIDNDEDTTESRNPFAALNNANAEDNSTAATSSRANRRFTPRRINPEDVPEGKRIVSTPFGDRLVDQ